MKLRLRSVQTNQTLKIEIPSSSSLENLKQALYLQINSSPDSIHLSLNRKEELLSISPQQTIESLGIISGDLLFFSLNSNLFNSTRPVLQQDSPRVAVVVDSDNNIENMEVEAVNLNTHEDNCVNLGAEGKIVDLGTQDSVNSETLINMNDVKEGDVGLGDTQMDEDGHDFDVAKSFSVPGFLRKVFMEELRDDGGEHHKLLVIAVHAVLLESGFVGYDPCNNVVIKGFNIPDKWPSSSFIMSLWYTLPEITNRDGVEVNGVETVVLKFQSMGKLFKVYGSLSTGSAAKHCVSVNEYQLVPFLNLIWANCLPGTETNENGVVLSTDPAREVFAFWRIVKDKLVSPLLIDLCDKVGFELPPCFMRLPTDIKLQILERLPGIDVAKVGSTCSELRYLSSSDDLWKKKFVEQYGDAESSEGGVHWKEKFARSVERQKKRRISVNTLLRNDRHPFPGQFPGPFPGQIPGPFPGRFPNVIGGDYDIMPPDFFRPIRLPSRRNPRFNNLMPHCNMGRLG